MNRIADIAPMRSLRRKYAGLRQQDRRALTIFFTILALAVLWKGVWQPVESYRADALSRYKAASADLAWMQAHAGNVAAQSSAQPANKKDDRSLLAIVSDRAALYVINLTHAEPGADDSLHVSLDTVSYSHLLSWLETLQHDDNVRAAQISVQRLPANPGYVSAALTLRQ